MLNRRVLLALIGVLSVFVVCGGIAVAALAYAGLAQVRADPAALMVLGDDGRLSLVRGGDTQLLAEDNSADLFRYPAIAPDGTRIVYVSRDADGVALQSLDLAAGTRVELFRSRNTPPLYAAWSADSRYLSFLTNIPGGLGVYVVPADGTTPALLLGETPGSAYFAWQPGGEQLLLHIGGSVFEQGRVATFAPSSEQPLRVLADPGFFQAPDWSVDGNDFFYVAQTPVQGLPTIERIESVLTRVTADGSEPQVLARESQSAMIFRRAPQSDTIAYVTIDIANSRFGPLKLAVPGAEPRLLSPADAEIPAFFWSPDGSRIAYLSGSQGLDGLPRYQWHLVEIAGGEVRDLEEFTPSRAFAAMVNFFDAYASSFDIWSPDGRTLVYGTQDGLYLLDAAAGTVQRQGEGVLGLWLAER
ncbi:MAG: hypothetical protein HC828_05775 [Blastochloris sp.]|nr:hypothetical protein [Blastochloris sp.]